MSKQKVKTWAELNDQRDAFLKVPWIEFIKESYQREEKYIDQFKKKINSGWKPATKRIYDPNTMNDQKATNVNKKELAEQLLRRKAPTPYYTDSKDKEREQNYRWVKSPRYSQVSKDILRQSAKNQLKQLSFTKGNNDFVINSDNVKAAIFPPSMSRLSNYSSSTAMSSNSRASSRASFFKKESKNVNKRNIMVAYQIIFDSLKEKVHEDRGFILQTKRIIMKAFDNFDGYRCGIVSENDFQSAMALIGVGNGSINGIMMQNIKNQYAKTTAINTMSSNVKQIDGIDYKLFVNHYIKYAQNKFNKVLKMYNDAAEQNNPRRKRRGGDIERRSAPIGPI